MTVIKCGSIEDRSKWILNLFVWRMIVNFNLVHIVSVYRQSFHFPHFHWLRASKFNELERRPNASILGAKEIGVNWKQYAFFPILFWRCSVRAITNTFLLMDSKLKRKNIVFVLEFAKLEWKAFHTRCRQVISVWCVRFCIFLQSFIFLILSRLFLYVCRRSISKHREHIHDEWNDAFKIVNSSRYISVCASLNSAKAFIHPPLPSNAKWTQSQNSNHNLTVRKTEIERWMRNGEND